MKRLCLFFLILSMGPANSSEAPVIDFVDFLVDWPDYVGQHVVITGANINFAGTEHALLSTGRNSIILRAPWRSREDLRFALRNCGGISLKPADLCAKTIRGIVQIRASMPDRPELSDIEILK